MGLGYSYSSVIGRGYQSEPATPEEKQCIITLILPEKPVDIWIEGKKFREKITKSLVIKTPPLSPGSFRYNIILRDSEDQSVLAETVVPGIMAGRNFVHDLRPRS